MVSTVFRSIDLESSSQHLEALRNTNYQCKRFGRMPRSLNFLLWKLKAWDWEVSTTSSLQIDRSAENQLGNSLDASWSRDGTKSKTRIRLSYATLALPPSWPKQTPADLLGLQQCSARCRWWPNECIWNKAETWSKTLRRPLIPLQTNLKWEHNFLNGILKIAGKLQVLGMCSQFFWGWVKVFRPHSMLSKHSANVFSSSRLDYQICRCQRRLVDVS